MIGCDCAAAVSVWLWIVVNLKQCYQIVSMWLADAEHRASISLTWPHTHSTRLILAVVTTEQTYVHHLVNMCLAYTKHLANIPVSTLLTQGKAGLTKSVYG